MGAKKIAYPYLPEGRQILYVSENNPYMSEAKRAMLERSTDWVHPTGATVVFDGAIISRVANQSRLKSKKLIGLHKKGLCIRRLFKIPSGQKYWLCPGCALTKHHAETLGAKDALKKGVTGADLYLYGHWWCCKQCWDAMEEANIKNVYVLEGSDTLFNRSNPGHIIGKDFEI